jgi:hypothetical protein
MNPASEQMTGWKSEELLGKKSTNIIIAMKMAIHTLVKNVISTIPCMMALNAK